MANLSVIRVKITPDHASGNTVVLDTHLFSAQLAKISVLNDAFRETFIHRFFGIQKKYKISDRDFYRVIFGLEGKKRLLRKYSLTPEEIRLLNYGIVQLSSPYFSYLSLFPQMMAKQGEEKVQYRQTLNTLFETYMPDFDFDRENLEFVARKSPENDFYSQTLRSPQALFLKGCARP